MKKLQLLFLITITATLFSCGNDDEGENENEDLYAFTTCCGENPFDPINVNTIGANIVVSAIFTPNGDNYGDFLHIRGIENYPSNNIKIFDNENNLIEDIDNVGQYIFSPNLDVIADFYRYRIVINNENEFLRQGYSCAITEPTEVESNFNTEIEGCTPNQEDFDPIIIQN